MSNQLIKLEQLINQIFIYASLPNRNWTPDDALLKGIEEAGELSESVMIVAGRMSHKPLPEAPQGEIADNINQLIDTLSFEYKSDVLLLTLQNMTYQGALDYILGFKGDDVVLDRAAIETFKNFHKTKFDFDYGSATLLIFNILIERLFLLNFILTAIQEGAEYDCVYMQFEGMSEDLFNKANKILLDRLQAKFAKWQGVEGK